MQTEDGALYYSAVVPRFWFMNSLIWFLVYLFNGAVQQNRFLAEHLTDEMQTALKEASLICFK
jgi:hypothetical protein